MAAKKAVEVENIQNNKAAPARVAYTKARILRHPKYAGRRDLLSVLLDDKKDYTFDEINKIIKDFMNTKEEN